MSDELKPHPIAELFPAMDDEQFAALVADIKANGLRDPIVLYEGMILDGRNRDKARLEAGEELRTVTFKGDDPLEFVISKNLHRRHLTTSQRAMIAAELENMRHGGDRKSQDANQNANLRVDRATTAKRLNVSKRSVASASKVRAKGTPKLVEAVKKGEVTVSAAAKQVEPPPAKRRYSSHREDPDWQRFYLIEQMLCGVEDDLIAARLNLDPKAFEALANKALEKVSAERERIEQQYEVESGGERIRDEEDASEDAS
ncbi:hypothetical protein SAMN05444161_3552 [Rhizobiales bacterium GAS191]|nr:hypothetical protein SAMN05444161_3552 [Rhizobiales bacterium GAS191]